MVCLRMAALGKVTNIDYGNIEYGNIENVNIENEFNIDSI